jgi:diguanylate cyclase (GGDEF)-like protein
VTKPSDFAPDRVFEVEQPPHSNTQDITQQIWIARLIGFFLLGLALLSLGLTSGFGTAAFFVSTAVLITYSMYVFLAEGRVRRITLGLEKRLRLGLLVHNMELENMAMQDDLTQLFNRRYFFDRLDRELETARAFKRPLSVIICDLNSMKQVNDTYGHRTGDALLSAFGRFLLDQTRASDVPARIGGDEFAIILPDTTERSAQTLRGRLAQKLESVDLIDENDLQLRASASFGVAAYPDAGDTVDIIIQKADADMYAHKNDQRTQARPTVAAPNLRLDEAQPRSA